MQVTHVQDHVTHAVIGGNAAISFGISDSPEFFQILSSTLYSDQRLAVVREVLCNAWDAHIESGRTDTAVEVTLNNEKLSIRDYGNGISRDLIGQIYGTYGNSTKKNDGAQTGGFGLGSKSPFAYTDHFQVSSCHEGTKTIYALSKSSAERNGKPGITPIASFPTTETGLEVTIQVKSYGDRETFDDLVKQIAINGEMKVNLNGGELEGLPFSKTERDWLITTRALSSNTSTYDTRIYVRYGNVVYPVEAHTSYNPAYQTAAKFLSNLNQSYSRGTHYRIVFKAPADSIAVTPSRESLSMQEHTIETLKGLLESFCKMVKDDLSGECHELLDRQIALMSQEKNVGQLMSCRRWIPGLANGTGIYDPIITDMDGLAKQYARQNYPGSQSFFKRDLGLRVDALLGFGLTNQGHLTELKRRVLQGDTTKERAQWKTIANTGSYRRRRSPEASHISWYKKRIVRPLVRDLQADPAMDHTRMYVFSDEGYGRDQYGLTHVSKHVAHSYDNYMPLLRKIVILTGSKVDLPEKTKAFPELKTLGKVANSFVYHVGLARKTLPAIREFFTNRGYTLLDLTVEQSWMEPKPVKLPPDPNKVIKPKLAGHAALSGAIHAGKQTRVENCFLEDSPRISSPKFFEKIIFSRSEFNNFTLGGFNTAASLLILKLFGDECAVVRTEPQKDKLKKDGLVETSEYVVPYVIDQVTTAPQFLAYWEECAQRALGGKYGQPLYTANTDIINTLFDVPEVRAALGLTTVLDKRDLLVLHLWREMCEHTHRYDRYCQPGGTTIQKARDLIEALPITQTMQDLADKMKGSSMLDLLKGNAIEALLQHPHAQTNGYPDKVATLAVTLLNS
jgi:hypothetical protein